MAKDYPNVRKHIINVTNAFWDSVEVRKKSKTKEDPKLSKKAQRIYKKLCEGYQKGDRNTAFALKDIFSMIIEEELPEITVVTHKKLPDPTYGVAVVPTMHGDSHDYPLHELAIVKTAPFHSLVRRDGSTGNSLSSVKEHLRRPTPKELSQIPFTQLQGFLKGN